MSLKLYQIDAFAEQLFRGNPAAVCPLETWLDDAVMQAIAAENNLSETAFFVPEGDGFRLRWFTPTVEVDLCGHATLASAFVLFNELAYAAPSITFYTRSGALSVHRRGELLEMDFPRLSVQPCDPPSELSAALGAMPREVYKGVDYLLRFDDETQIRQLQPDFSRLAKIPARGICVTAPGREADFVSRFFAPASGINEDPATGSAHCMLAPYWAAQLGKTQFVAHQVSARGGVVHCELRGERVVLGGRAVKYLEGHITLPPRA